MQRLKEKYIHNEWVGENTAKRKLDKEYSRVSRTKKYILNEKITRQT